MTEEKRQEIHEDEHMFCPACGGTSHLSRNETILVNTPIRVLEDGTWDWAEDTESDVRWDTSDYHEYQDELEWHCKSCDLNFSAPNVRNTNVPRKGKLLTHIKVKNEKGEEEELEVWRLPDGGLIGVDLTHLDQTSDVITSPYSKEVVSLPEEEKNEEKSKDDEKDPEGVQTPTTRGRGKARG